MVKKTAVEDMYNMHIRCYLISLKKILSTYLNCSHESFGDEIYSTFLTNVKPRRTESVSIFDKQSHGSTRSTVCDTHRLKALVGSRGGRWRLVAVRTTAFTLVTAIWRELLFHREWRCVRCRNHILYRESKARSLKWKTNRALR
jgi:hypothetical protein